MCALFPDDFISPLVFLFFETLLFVVFSILYSHCNCPCFERKLLMIMMIRCCHYLFDVCSSFIFVQPGGEPRVAGQCRLFVGP